MKKHYCLKVGTYIDVVLKNGNVIPCIMGDGKGDDVTVANHTYCYLNGDYIEFIVDRNSIDSKVDGNYDVIPEFSGSISKIIVY